MTKNQSTVALSRYCYVALFFCLCWLLILCYKGYHEAFDTSGTHVHWQSPDIAYMSTFFFLYLFASLCSIALCVGFIVVVLSGIRRGEVFPQGGLVLTRIAAVVFFFYGFVCDNLGQAFLPSVLDEAGHSQTVVQISDTPFVLALLLLIFSQMYKVAYQLARENDLTV